MALSDAKLRAARPAPTPYKLADGAGLLLLVTPAGGKSWRLKYRIADTEKLLVIGSFPAIGLAAARKRRDAAKELIAEGGDPAAEKQKAKLATRKAAACTFEIVAREWHETQKGNWDERYAGLVLRRLVENIFPAIGDRPIAGIESAEMLATLRKVETRGVLETARRLKQYCSNIFCYGIAAGHCRHDPTSPLKRALKSPPKAVHHKKLSRHEVGEFLLTLPTYDGDIVTRIAIHTALLTATRTREVNAAQWSEFEQIDDPEKAMWRIPAMRMKMGEEHLVPLSHQAAQILLDLPSADRRKGYLFPGGGKSGFMSNNTMLFGLYRLGYHSRTTTHGFRRLFSTEANEHDFDKDWIERQLAHDERDDVRGAYNAAQYLPQRRRLMQWWADHLDALRAAEVARRSKEAT